MGALYPILLGRPRGLVIQSAQYSGLMGTLRLLCRGGGVAGKVRHDDASEKNVFALG